MQPEPEEVEGTERAHERVVAHAFHPFAVQGAVLRRRQRHVRAKRSAALHLVHLDDANLGGGEDGVPPLAAEELDDGVG